MKGKKLLERGVYTLPYLDHAGYRIVIAVDSNHRVVHERCAFDETDIESLGESLRSLLDETDPVATVDDARNEFPVWRERSKGVGTGRAALIRHALAGTQLQSGDVVVNRHYWRRDVAAGLRGGYHAIEFTRDELELLRELYDSRGEWERVILEASSDQPFARFVGNRGKWGRKGTNGKPLYVIVRSIREKTSQPIEATTDAAAIFELIHACGGRLRSEGAT